MKNSEKKEHFKMCLFCSGLEETDEDSFEVRCAEVKSITFTRPHRKIYLRCSSLESINFLYPNVPGVGLEVFNVLGCHSLTHLPVFPRSLKCLDIYESRLTILPDLSNTILEYLRVFHSLIKVVPPTPNTIMGINCGYCPHLTTIEHIPETVNYVFLDHCPILTNCVIPPNKENVLNCKWVNIPDYWNNFSQNVKRLKILQRFFRKTLWKRRLYKRAILRFLPREISNLISSF